MTRQSTRRAAAAALLVAVTGACAAHPSAASTTPRIVPSASAGSPTSAQEAQTAAQCAPTFNPSDFVAVVNNPFYPLPVGRVLVYQGVRDGKTQRDTVTVTAQTKVVAGVTATVVNDRADRNGRLLEQTSDYFAQDRPGNVWYLGEDTKSIGPNGTVDTSGSWLAGKDGASPGIVMLADPQVPCGYRQEYLKGEAEDTAWIVGRGVSVTVPYAAFHDTVRTLEMTILEPNVVDEKVYASGIGIVSERSLAGPNEIAKLVTVTG